MNCANCSRVNHINGIQDNRCYFCNYKLNVPSLKKIDTGINYLKSNSAIAPQRSSVNPYMYQNTKFSDTYPNKINNDYYRDQSRPVSSPIMPTKSSTRPVEKFIRAGNDILVSGPKKEIEILKGNPIANAQQIEKNRGNVSVNKNQQAFLTLKDKNFIETEYGSSTNVFGNYAPDEDEYETTTVDKNYNYKKSADELMKERGDY